MSKFTEAELAYLQSQKLGRLATVNQHGEPQVAAVGFQYNAEFDAIDIGGRDIANTQKFRNVARNGLVSLLIDDVLPPWNPGFFEIRGRAEALPDGSYITDPAMSPAVIRIIPKRIIAWDVNNRFASSTRDVE